MMKRFKTFLNDRRAGEIPEWAGIVGLLALVLVGGFTIFRNQLNNFFARLFNMMGLR